MSTRILRGFDAVHVQCVDAKAYWLVAADAAVPYRTSIATVPTYDTKHVVAALESDFETHGAPLVLRLDRIACHRAPEVHALLDSQRSCHSTDRRDTRTTTDSSSDRTASI